MCTFIDLNILHDMCYQSIELSLEILTSPISYHISYIFANEHARTTNSKYILEVNLYISRSVFMAITDIYDDLTMFHILLFCS